MNTQTETTETVSAPETRINDWANKYGISANFEFVPWSLSRNAGEKQPSLNWKVTLSRDGREFLRCDYMQGCGHAPSYKQSDRTAERAETVKRECETGKVQRYLVNMGVHSTGKKIDSPKLADVIYSIGSDADALNYSTFEDWAACFGYEPDSRKAETIYKTCLEYALKLLGAVGEKGMQELQEASQDY